MASRKAMIFAAGLGTRLKPLTDTKPKALVPINGRVLLEYAIETVSKFGFDDIVINIHHFANDVRQFVESKDWGNVRISFSDESDELRNTGGGLKYASWFFDDKPFLVYNVDIITTLYLDKLYECHISNKGLATLAVSDRKTSRYLLFDKDDKLSGGINKSSGEQRNVQGNIEALTALAFSGIQVISPKIFDMLTETGNFSIIDAYLRLSMSENIFAYNHTGAKWMDVGKIGELAEAERLAKEIYEGK